MLFRRRSRNNGTCHAHFCAVRISLYESERRRAHMRAKPPPARTSGGAGTRVYSCLYVLHITTSSRFPFGRLKETHTDTRISLHENEAEECSYSILECRLLFPARLKSHVNYNYFTLRYIYVHIDRFSSMIVDCINNYIALEVDR